MCSFIIKVTLYSSTGSYMMELQDVLCKRINGEYHNILPQYGVTKLPLCVIRRSTLIYFADLWKSL